MKRIRLTLNIAIIMLIFHLLPVNSTAEDSSSGVINGRVLNETLNKKGVKGLEIILHPYVEKKELDVYHTTTDQTGYFSFQGIRIDKNAVYHISTKYKEVEYFSQAIRFQEKKELSLDLTVYETTDRDNDIYIKMNHIFIEIDSDSLWIKEAIIVENRGNRVYLGSPQLQPERNETLRISLPENASNLQFEKHMLPSVVNTAEGFIDTADIKPGTKRILFSYTVNSSGLNYRFTKTLHHQTDQIIFIFPDKGLKAKSDHLEFKGVVKDLGQRLFQLSGKNFAKGSQFTVEFNSTRNKNLFQWVIVGMVILLVGIGLALPLVTRKHYPLNVDGRILKRGRMALADQRQAVLLSIARLDDLAESGGIDPDAYRIERVTLLSKAKELSGQLSRKMPGV